MGREDEGVLGTAGTSLLPSLWAGVAGGSWVLDGVVVSTSDRAVNAQSPIRR